MNSAQNNIDLGTAREITFHPPVLIAGLYVFFLGFRAQICSESLDDPEDLGGRPPKSCSLQNIKALGSTSNYKNLSMT